MKRDRDSRIGRLWAAGIIAAIFTIAGLWTGNGTAAETPKYGGTLIFAVRGTPPSWDAHQETTVDVVHPASPFYSLLCKYDPENYPKIIGDLAESWTVSKDNLVYTFKIRKGVKFHDGTPLTAKDVKISYDHIIFPPEGVISPRKPLYTAVEKIEAPSDDAVVFTLKYPSASFMPSVAAPYNFIYKGSDLEKDPQRMRKVENINGTGPFKYKELVVGSHVEGVKNPDYFLKGRPYLDGFRAVYISSLSTRVAAIRGGRAHVDFRYVTEAQGAELKKAMGDKVVIQEVPLCSTSSFTFNTKKKPFDDVRVRRALLLALDQWKGAEILSKISSSKWVGGLVRAGSEYSMSDSELVELPGYWKDIEAARKEARRLLKEAGVPEGFKFSISNRPSFEPQAIWMIDQWRQIGLNAEQVVRETGPHYELIRAGNFEVATAPISDFIDDPSIQLARHLSVDKTGANYGGYIDRVLDDLFDKQDRESDPAKRKQLVNQFEKRVLGEMCYFINIPWTNRVVAHSAKLKGWTALSSHFLNVDLTHVWLTED